MHKPYATQEYYVNNFRGSIPNKDIGAALSIASRHIDSLTFNRITGRGFDNLSDFQRGIIMDVVCLQAEFEYENKDELESVLSSYSLNGVSMTIQPGWNLFTDKGIVMQKSTYSLLEQTGLCCRSMGVR